MSKTDPESFRKAKIHRAVYQYACQRYQKYASGCRAAKQAICDYRRRKYQQYGHWKHVQRAIAVLTLLFVMAYTVITTLIWLTSKNTEQTQLRAYVFIAAAAPEYPIKIGDKFTAILDLKNFGQTPAYDLTGWIEIDSAPYPLSSVFKLPSPDQGQQRIGASVLAPMAITNPSITWQTPISQQDFTNITVGGTEGIYVWGQIFYHDAFGVGRCSEFRFVFGGDSAKRGHLGLTDYGNDEKCDYK